MECYLLQVVTVLYFSLSCYQKLKEVAQEKLPSDQLKSSPGGITILIYSKYIV